MPHYVPHLCLKMIAFRKEAIGPVERNQNVVCIFFQETNSFHKCNAPRSYNVDQ